MAKSTKLIHADDVVFDTEAYYNLGLIRKELVKLVTRVEGNPDIYASLEETLAVTAKFAKDRMEKEVKELAAVAKADAAREEAIKAAAEAKELADAEAALAATEAEQSMLTALVTRLKG